MQQRKTDEVEAAAAVAAPLGRIAAVVCPAEGEDVLEAMERAFAEVPSTQLLAMNGPLLGFASYLQALRALPTPDPVGEGAVQAGEVWKQLDGCQAFVAENVFAGGFAPADV
jgi:hypothetical protein